MSEQDRKVDHQCPDASLNLQSVETISGKKCSIVLTSYCIYGRLTPAQRTLYILKGNKFFKVDIYDKFMK